MTVSRALMLGLALAALAAPAVPAHAGMKLENWNGHLSVGYAKLFVSKAPGGSFSIAGGADYPLNAHLRIGATIAYHLLGGRIIERDSLLANLDYSAFEVAAQLHWLPTHFGPLRRVSFGPALASARAEITSSGGGITFADLPVSELAPAVALDLALLPQKPRPVAVGFEVGTRIIFVQRETWTLATTRVTFYY